LGVEGEDNYEGSLGFNQNGNGNGNGNGNQNQKATVQPPCLRVPAGLFARTDGSVFNQNQKSHSPVSVPPCPCRAVRQNRRVRVQSKSKKPQSSLRAAVSLPGCSPEQTGLCSAFTSNQNGNENQNQKAGIELRAAVSLPSGSPEQMGPGSTRNTFTRNLLCLLLLYLLPFPATSQSLNDLLQSLATDNLELKVLQQEYLAAMEKGAQVSQLPQPQIGVGAFILPVETRLGGQQARASISQDFPWFGTLAAREDLALSQAQVQYEKIAGTSLELAYQLKSAYFKWYEGVQSQAIIERNMALLESSRRLALNSVENGKGNAADVLRVDLKIQELTQKLRLLANQVKKPLADINQLLYRPLDTPLSKDTLSFAPLLYNRDTLQAYISNKHPAIRLFAQQQTAASKAIVVNELEGKPSFSIGADYFLIGQRTDADPLNNGRDAFQVSAKLSIPIYRKKFEAKEKEEQLKIAALENQKLALTHRFLSQIEKAFADHENAVLRRQLYLQQIETTKATLRLLQAEYSTAGRRFDELIRLEQDLIDYDLKILSTIIESQQAKAAIERYINL